MRKPRICAYCGKTITSRAETYCSRECSNKARRENERATRHTYTVWTCGGGVQSTAIAALICTGRLPKPDYAVMVDTGYEKTAVMRYVRDLLIPKLSEVGVSLNVVRTSDYYEQRLIDADGYCVLPVFKRKDSGNQLLRTCCNQQWKLQVVRKWLKSLGVEQYTAIIGISADEAHRQRQAHKKYYTNTYPLVEMGMDRDDCIQYITKNARWPEPTRSSCIMCGQQDDGEWWRMRMTQRADFERACVIEQQLQAVNPELYLHRSCKPLSEAFRA